MSGRFDLRRDEPFRPSLSRRTPGGCRSQTVAGYYVEYIHAPLLLLRDDDQQPAACQGDRVCNAAAVLTNVEWQLILLLVCIL